MANTITNISLANTFGDWVSTTVKVVNELNFIGKQDWYKDSGTLYITSNGTSLDVANNTFFRGGVSITGLGSSLTVQKNANFQGVLNLTNTDTDANPNKLILSANGVANINYLNIVGTGLAANIVNDLYVGGSFSTNILNVETLNNHYVNASFAFANTVNAYAYSANAWLQANDNLTLQASELYTDTNINANVATVKLYTDTNIGANVASVKLYTDTNINSNVASVKLYTDTNINANVTTLNNNITANGASANAYTDSRVTILNNNIAANVTTLNNNITASGVSANAYTDSRVTILNNNIAANVVTLNNNISANVALLNNRITANGASANAYTDSRVTILNNNISSNTLSATNYANNNFLKLSGGALTGDINSPTTNATFLNLTAQGNFVISGSTVYNSDTFTLNSAQSVNANAFLVNFRPNGANAQIRWNETSKWWDIRDVENPTFYNRLLTANDYTSINTSITTANTNLRNYVDVADAAVRATITSNVSTLNTTINNNAISANAVINIANTNNILYTNAQITANAVSANAVISKANTDLKNYTDTTFVKLTSPSQTLGGDLTVTGNLTVNGITTTIDTQNLIVEDSLIQLAKDNTTSDSLDIGFYGPYRVGGLTRYTGLFRKAADKYYLAQAITTDPTSNNISEFGVGYRATLDANFTGGTVSGLSSAIAVADGGTGTTTSTGTGSVVLSASPTLTGTPNAPTAANGTFSTQIATTAFVLNANSLMRVYVDGQNTTLQTQITNNAVSANAVINTANTNLRLYTDAQITANAVSANAVINTANTNLRNYVDSTKVSSVSGSSGRISSTGGLTPTLDLITTGVTSGIFGGTSTIPVITVDSYGRLTTAANLALTLSSINGTLPISSGGTGATSQSQALTNLLPTGTTAGYVLTTGGPGNFYWAAGGTGGGGGTPGTTINTTRLSYTATSGQTVFTAPTYVPGSGQLRVYINGVRQFPSEYVETDATTVTLTTGANLNDVVFIEVDGFINNPYFANNITFTAPFGAIDSTANTIQLAIQDLESRKATLASPSFTGSPTGPTAPAGTSNTMFATTAFVQTANTNMKTYVDGRFAANVVTSNATFGSIGVGTNPSGVAGEIRATNNITAYYSDERLKTKLGNIDNALDKVNSLNGFYHEANELAQSMGYRKVREVGVSAQEVQSVLPEVVAPAPIDDKYLTVRYERLVPLLIEAIKELNNKVEQLQNEINNTRQ